MSAARPTGRPPTPAAARGGARFRPGPSPTPAAARDGGPLRPGPRDQLTGALERWRRGGIAAAVCCRWQDGEVSFGLVSTRDGGRWTFPKGHRELGETLAGAAAREALEEAGLVGQVDHRRLLTYRYPGRRGGDDLVAAFLLHVTGARGVGEAFRKQAWCDPASARRHLAAGRDPFHARELERVLEAALREAAASRTRTLGRRSGRLARRLSGRADAAQ